MPFSFKFLVHSAIIAHADLSSDNLEEILQRQCKSKRMRGIRHVVIYHPDKPQYSEVEHDNYLTDPKWLRGVALLEKYNLSFELTVLPHQMQRSADVVRQFPGVQFMVEHCGMPYDRDEETMKVWRQGMYKPMSTHSLFSFVSSTNPYLSVYSTYLSLSSGLTELAKYPNAYCKVSGMFATDPKWNKDTMAIIVLSCIEIFGIDRYERVQIKHAHTY